MLHEVYDIDSLFLKTLSPQIFVSIIEILSLHYTLATPIGCEIYMFCSKWESGRFRNCPARSENSYFGGQNENSYFARFNSGIVRAQSGNRDKVRIFIDRNMNMYFSLTSVCRNNIPISKLFKAVF